MWETIECDVLVLGGGVAAARAAVEAAGMGVSVALVDKGTFEASGSSPLCLHGLATTVAEDDSPQILFQDLVEDGYHISDENIAWEAAQGAEENLYQLERLGFIFRKKGDKYHLGRGVGHSAHRSANYDHNACHMNPVAMLGKEAWRRGVKLYDHICITRLLKKRERVVGAVGFSPQRKCYYFSSKTVVLAAGGANYLYINTCERINKRVFRTTGDAFCLAFFAGVTLIDLEFVNFREGDDHRLGRMGAKLANSLGEPIMERYAPDKLEEAPRGKLVEAIQGENQAGRGPVGWLLPEVVKEEDREPVERYRSKYGRLVPVYIDFQRLLGGVRINHDAETNVQGLFAAGESTGGFNGADRMQGAAFLEATFFGAKAGAKAAHFAQEASHSRIANESLEEELARIDRFNGEIQPESVIEEIRQTMWEKIGIFREESSLKQGLDKIQSLRAEKIPGMSGDDLFSCLEAENLSLTAEMVARAALMRQESRGSHLRKDFPKQDDTLWRNHIAVCNHDGNMILESLPVMTLKSC